MHYLKFIFVFFVIFSCSSKKNVLYLQDLDNTTKIDFDYKEYKIKIDDVLKIDVKTQSPESFSGINTIGGTIMQNNTKYSYLLQGYLVGTDGNISFPGIGRVKAEGKTTNELRDFLLNFISSNGILTNPFVDVKVINKSFTVIGEVNNPGKYDFLKNNLNILEAIGIAGDLTINGKRTDVTIIRQHHDSSNEVIKIDLTNADILKNPSYQVFSNDIIIVNQNYSRIKNSGIIGNAGTLITLLSFILSSIIVINN